MAPKAKILVVDDEQGIRDLLTHELDAEGYSVAVCSDGAQALELLDKEKFNLVISDINMPKLGGLALLQGIQSRSLEVELIFMTAYGTVETAVEAMKNGAYDFVTKPCDIQQLLKTVQKALETHEMRQELKNAKHYQKLLEEKIESYRIVCDQLEATRYKLVQANRLAAVGELAAGVAHEINNPLTAVVGYAELLLEGGSDENQVQEDLQNIKAQAQRCHKIVQGLLQFTRQGKRLPQPIDIHEVLENTVKLMEFDLKSSRVTVAKKFTAELPPVIIDADQVQQVFVNIIANARDALKDSPDKTIVISTFLQEKMVVIQFEDKGCGMAKDHLERAFEPFFTTKEPGQGTGLGLSLSYGIVKNHGGEILLASEKGRGTVVKVELPLSVENEKVVSCES